VAHDITVGLGLGLLKGYALEHLNGTSLAQLAALRAKPKEIERMRALAAKIIDSEVFVDPRLLQVFVWLLCKATHKPRKSKGFDLRPGQYVSTTRFMADDLRMPKSTMYDCLKRLSEMEVIKTSTGRRAGRTFTIVSICNWRRYARKRKGAPDASRTHPGQRPDDITTNTRSVGAAAADAAPPTQQEDLINQPWYGDYVNGLCDAAGNYRHKAERNRG